MSEAENTPPHEFTMQTDCQGQAVVVKLTGSLHMEACESLQTELIRLVDQSANPLILDLSDLTFICSLGLGALIATQARAGCKNTVRVAAPDPNIRSLFQVTKLDKLFPPYDSVKAAMASG